MSVSRRDVLKSLSMGVAATSVLQVIPLQAAEYAHHMITTEKAANKTGVYTPKYFPPQQYKTLQALCERIFPADADCGGAIEAGAPEFIDLLTSENPHYQLTLGGGIMGLDSSCTDHYGKRISNAPRSSRQRCWIALRIARTWCRMRVWARG